MNHTNPEYPQKDTLQGNISHQTGSWENHLQNYLWEGICYFPERVPFKRKDMMLFEVLNLREQCFQESMSHVAFVQLTREGKLHGMDRGETCYDLIVITLPNEG